MWCKRYSLCVFVGEPMDSVCEEAGPRDPTKVCHSEAKCPAIADIQKEVVECPAVTDTPNEIPVAATTTTSETPRTEPISVPDGRTAASTPKPGNLSNPLSIHWYKPQWLLLLLLLLLQKCKLFNCNAVTLSRYFVRLYPSTLYINAALFCEIMAVHLVQIGCLITLHHCFVGWLS